MKNFNDSDFLTASEKEKIYSDLQKFIDSGFKRIKFTKALYKYLSLNFGFIAHYNIEGFFMARFIAPQGRINTYIQIKDASPWEFSKEPHRTGDLNFAVRELVVKSEKLFVESARKERMKDLKEEIQKANEELKNLQGN